MPKPVRKTASPLSEAVPGAVWRRHGTNLQRPLPRTCKSRKRIVQFRSLDLLRNIRGNHQGERNKHYEVLYETRLHNILNVCKILRDHHQRLDGERNSCINGFISWERRRHNRYCSAGITGHLCFERRCHRCCCSSKARSEGHRHKRRRAFMKSKILLTALVAGGERSRMKPAATFSELLQGFFTDRLMGQCNASPLTNSKG